MKIFKLAYRYSHIDEANVSLWACSRLSGDFGDQDWNDLLEALNKQALDLSHIFRILQTIGWSMVPLNGSAEITEKD